MILVLSDLWLPFPGGAERLMFNLARDLMRRGETVRVLTGYERPQQFDGPPVHRASIPLDGAGWARIATTIRAHRPRVIIVHHLYARTFEIELLATGIPLVHVVLNGPRIRAAALGVFISKFVAARARPKASDLLVLPPAFDDVIAETHSDAIGFIKPIEHKGVELVYAIAAAMLHRRFVILRGEWQTLEVIRHLPNIEFMEPVDDIREFYARCSIVLVPSLSEDAGTVAQECALNKIPCISSDVGGLPETNAGGVVLDHYGVDAWVQAIERLDFDDVYANVVCSQTRARHDQTRQLDRFAGAIARLRG